jgi:hypothetical protein
MVPAVHQEGQRNLEDLGNLFGIDIQLETLTHEANEWLDAKSGARLVGIKLGQYLHVVALKADLLLGLAQGCIDGSFGLVIQAPPRKADLPRMARKVIGPARKKHLQLGLAKHDRHKHSSGLQRSHLNLALHMRVQAMVTLAESEGGQLRKSPRKVAQIVLVHGSAMPSEKKLLRLVTPSSAPAGVWRVCAIATSS